MGVSGKNLTKSTSISGDMCSLEKNDGSQSDTAVGALGTSGKKRRSSIGAKMVAIVGLSRKSRSASQLSQTGRNFYVTLDFLFELLLQYAFFFSCHFITVVCGCWHRQEERNSFRLVHPFEMKQWFFFPAIKWNETVIFLFPVIKQPASKWTLATVGNVSLLPRGEALSLMAASDAWEAPLICGLSLSPRLLTVKLTTLIFIPSNLQWRWHLIFCLLLTT